MNLSEETRAFRQRKNDEVLLAAERVAFRLALGVDLDAAIEKPAGERRLFIRRVERLVERERMKGARRHWSYDLNRHIALKQALDRLKAAGGEHPMPAPRKKLNNRPDRPQRLDHRREDDPIHNIKP